MCLLDTDYFSNLGIRLALSLISCSIFICMQYLLFMQPPKIQFHKDTMSLKRNLVQSNVETELLGALKQSQRTHVCCNALLCLSVHLTSSVQLDYLLWHFELFSFACISVFPCQDLSINKSKCNLQVLYDKGNVADALSVLWYWCYTWRCCFSDWPDIGK